jgi:hypothetical protein
MQTIAPHERPGDATANHRSSARQHLFTAALTVFALFLVSLAGGTVKAAGPFEETSPPEDVAAEPQVHPLVHIYFAHPQGRFLKAEERVFSGSESPTDRGRFILEALIKGPRSELMRTLPAGTRLRAFYLASGRRAYVDFSRDIVEGHPGGCLTEVLSLYSVVNSLILNLPEVSRVKILVDGRDVHTLAGHLDIRSAFAANMSLIR